MPRSSSGQDAALSRLRQGFNSPTGYRRASQQWLARLRFCPRPLQERVIAALSLANPLPSDGALADHGGRDPRWFDWRWQLQHALRGADALGDALGLDDAERAWIGTGEAFEVGLTPYFAELVRAGGRGGPLWRQVVPDRAEATIASFEKADPLGEDRHRAAPGLVHKYPDRVLLLVTDTCASYCRYCTRARWVAGHHEPLGSAELDAALAYIQAHTEIRDVLISGGDPLLLATRRLDALLERLSEIPHLRFVRIGTRVPIFLPMRIDAELAAALRPRRIPIWVNVHVNHHAELTADAVQALGALADAGVPLGGQTVLLRGVNDDEDALRETMFALLGARVRPSYLFHCDPVAGTAHLRVPVARGLELMRALIGHSSGMAVPKYAIDLDGAGKVPLWPDYVERVDAETLWVRGYTGELQPYPAG